MRTGWSKQEHVLVRQKGLREFELTARQRGRAVDRALVGAAADGDVEGVNDLLRAGANVDAAVAGDGSPLIAAARAGMLDIVQLLLDRGADPNMPVPGDGNAIIAAAREGRTAIVELLLQRGAYVDEVADGDENALMQASGAGRLEMVKLLVARGANVNVHVSVAGAIGVSRDPATGAVITTRDPSDSEWRSPLSMARRGGHKAVVEYLIGAGAQD
jgi:ankyrin repeat protein